MKGKGLRSKAVVLGAAMVLVGSLIVMSVAGDVANAARPASPRFVDNGDGTITDTRTGLMWEQKTGTYSSNGFILCSTATSCADPTNVNNLYSWSSSGAAAPDGTLFTDFLAKMNCTVLQNGGKCGPGLHRDWRIPTIAELQTISLTDCSSAPCIDPIFGPTAANFNWSSSAFADDPTAAWTVFFASGNPNANFKTQNLFARAVRGGS